MFWLKTNSVPVFQTWSRHLPRRRLLRPADDAESNQSEHSADHPPAPAPQQSAPTSFPRGDVIIVVVGDDKLGNVGTGGEQVRHDDNVDSAEFESSDDVDNDDDDFDFNVCGSNQRLNVGHADDVVVVGDLCCRPR